MQSKKTSKVFYVLLFISVLTVITGLLLFQYFSDRSLWLDEAMLSLNIIHKNYGDLLRPLDYGQVAPVLFLVIEKFFTTILGNSEYALRLFPLLCAIGSLIFFYYLALFLTKNKVIALVAVCLLGCAPKFIYYSSEAKQYMTDLLVTLIIFYVVFAEAPFLRRNRAVALSATGIIAVFLSNISVIPLLIVSLWFCYHFLREKKIDRGYLIPMLIWAVCISVNYLLFVRNQPSAQIMREYWKASFMPVHPFQPAFRSWFESRIGQVFFELLPVPFQSSYAICTVLLYFGTIIFLATRKQFTLLYLCLAPIVVHLVLSALKMYPFELRLILYQTPLYILIIATGLYHLAAVFRKIPAVQYTVTGFFVGCFLISSFNAYPFRREEIKPVIRYINQHLQPGQTVYLYYGGWAAYLYYKDIGVVRFGDAKVIAGVSHVDKREGYIDELKAQKGCVWLLFSHVYPFDGSRGEERYLVNELRQRGTLLKQYESFGSSAYLFDLR